MDGLIVGVFDERGEDMDGVDYFSAFIRDDLSQCRTTTFDLIDGSFIDGGDGTEFFDLKPDHQCWDLIDRGFGVDSAQPLLADYKGVGECG